MGLKSQHSSPCNLGQEQKFSLTHMEKLYISNGLKLAPRNCLQRTWDMSRFVMIALLSLHSDKMLFLGAYKILVTQLSRISGRYLDIYECQIRVQ